MIIFGVLIVLFFSNQILSIIGGEKYTIKWNKHSFLAGADYTPSITSDVKLVAGAYTGVSRIKFKVDNCSIVIFEGDFNFSYLTKLY